MYALTNGATVCISGDERYRVVPASVTEQHFGLPSAEADVLLTELFLPVPLGFFMVSPPRAERDARSWREPALRTPEWRTSVLVHARATPVRVFGLLYPLTVYDDTRECFVPLKLTIHAGGAQSSVPDGWSPDDVARICRQLIWKIEARRREIVKAPGPADERGRRDTTAPLTPRWDKFERTLYVGPHVIKRFSLPAANQQRILAAFEEEGWPRSVDDPLPPSSTQAPGDRLRETVRALNKNHLIPNKVKFRMDGTGEGVTFDVPQPHPTRAHTAKQERGD